MACSLTLLPVNANVVAVCTADAAHVGNLKRIGSVWKFKAVGYTADGAVEPGGGPLTTQHNAILNAPDVQTVNARLAPFL